MQLYKVDTLQLTLAFPLCCERGASHEVKMGDGGAELKLLSANAASIRDIPGWLSNLQERTHLPALLLLSGTYCKKVPSSTRASAVTFLHFLRAVPGLQIT